MSNNFSGKKNIDVEKNFRKNTHRVTFNFKDTFTARHWWTCSERLL